MYNSQSPVKKEPKMSNIIESLQRLLTPAKPLPPGIYHYQAPPDAPVPYRLHLRLENDGSGLLIVNASTILHLNQTAAELAYHLVKQTPEDQLVAEISNRYRVKREQARQDYQMLQDRILTLIYTPDLDPEMFLDFERATPHAQKLSAPYRLDCALTYRLHGEYDDSITPIKRVDRELTKDEWCLIFDKAWGFGIPHIILTGGEPTLREDLPELIAHTETNGQVVGLLSDGLKFNDKGYLQTLLQTGLDHMMFSLQPEDDSSWNALSNALEVDLFVTVHHTLTLQNAPNTSKILERLSNLGVKSISLTASDPALHNPLLEHRNQAASLGLSLVWNLPVPYSSFNPIALETQMDNVPGEAKHDWLYIEPDGDVLPEQGINQILGNILSDSWDTLWR
jgi:Radical SAM superfamily/Coenzyme PQQ synthesis protein D (PqqD)